MPDGGASGDGVGCASFVPVQLFSVIGSVRPFLSVGDCGSLRCVNRRWRHWELCSDDVLYRPVCPYRRRYSGFGSVNLNLSVTHTTPSPYFVLHKVWDYLEAEDRHLLIQSAPVFESYARLRRSVSLVSIWDLKAPHPPLSKKPVLSKDRSWRMAVALLRFDFNLGDLIRWLEGEYTHERRDSLH